MNTCSIWGTPAMLSYSSGKGWDVDSPRAGGKYFVSMEAHTEIQNLTNFEKARLTTWILDQNRAGLVAKVILDDLNKAVTGHKLPVSERVDRLLQCIDTEVEGLGSMIDLCFGVNNEFLPIYYKVHAWTESADEQELRSITTYLEQKGWVELKEFLGGAMSIKITFDGYNRLQELAQVNSESTQGFIAMWFGKEMDSVLKLGIEPAINDAGYKPFRIDRKDHNNKIDDEIIAEIRRSRFLVADFTCKISGDGDESIAEARGGVYYEAGFAQGLGIPVIWTCRKDLVKYLHFDTRQFNHIIWESPEDLFGQLKNRIGAVIGYGPLKAN